MHGRRWPCVSASWLRRSAAVLGLAVAFGAGCAKDDPGSEADSLCDGTVLANVSDAADWVHQISDIRSYYHKANVQSGHAEVQLLGEKDALLGVMQVSQIFGDDDIADGTMVATMEDDASIQLLTRGYDITDEGYDVLMELRRDQKTMRIHASFRGTRCMDDVPQPHAPVCAGTLSLQESVYVLPTCGLIVDEYRQAGVSPVLTDLRYAVKADAEGDAPTHGGFERHGAGSFWTLTVVEDGDVRDENAVREWLEATGMLALVQDEQVRRMTTAYLDRSWWRTVEKHVAYCDAHPNGEDTGSAKREEEPNEKRSNGPATVAATAVRDQPACPGQTNAGDWGSGGRNGATSWGDPHLTTFDGDMFDFMGAGEYVLFQAEGDPEILVQVRMEPSTQAHAIPACEHVSYTTAVATKLEGHRLTVSARPTWEVRLDGALVASMADVPEMVHGSSLTIEPMRVVVGWADGSTMEVRDGGPLSLTVNALLSKAKSGRASGLFGNADDDPDNDRFLPDGSPLSPLLSMVSLYEVYGEAWRIDPADSLFDYPDGKTSAEYVLAGFPGMRVQMDALPESARQSAEQACRTGGVDDVANLQACILDTVCLSTDNTGYPIRDAVHAPPVQGYTNADGDVRLRGDIETAGLPDVVTTSEMSEQAACMRRLPKGLRLLKERADVKIERDLAVSFDAPGTYSEAPTGDNPTIDATTHTQSYLIYRADTSGGDGFYFASARFVKPILGVIVEDVDKTDADHGAQAHYDTSQFDAFGWENGARIEMNTDRNTLTLRWPASSTSRIRVLTQAVGD